MDMECLSLGLAKIIPAVDMSAEIWSNKCGDEDEVELRLAVIWWEIVTELC